MLLHEYELHWLQTVEIIDAGAGVRHARDTAQRQEGLAGEIVGGEDIVIHHREGDHGARRTTLFQGHAELEALVEDRVERLLVHVGLLFVAVGKYPVGQEFYYDERVAETVRVQGYYISGM